MVWRGDSCKGIRKTPRGGVFLFYCVRGRDYLAVGCV